MSSRTLSSTLDLDRSSALARLSASRRRALLGWLAYATVSVVWGSTYLAIAVALRSFTPFGMVSIRFALGAALCLGLGRLLGEPRPSARDLPALAVTGAVLLAVCNSLVTWSELHVSSGLVAVICAMVPLWLGLLTLRTEPLGVRGWTGALLGLVGVAILTAPEGGRTTHLGGLAAVMVANVLWAWGTLFAKRNVKGGGLLTNAGIQMATASLLAVLLGPLFGGFVSAPVTWASGAALLYLAVFGSGVAFTAFGYLTKAWPAAKAGTYAYLNPVIAVVLGAAILSEPIGARMIAGMLVILAGVGLVQLKGASR